MDFARLAESRIEEAVEAGELDNLSGAGKPLPRLDGPDGVEAFGYRLMARAGALPLEVLLRKEIAAARQKLKAEADPLRRRELLMTIADLEMRFAIALEERR